MKYIKIILLFIIFLLSKQSQAQIERVSVETYYIATAFDSTQIIDNATANSYSLALSTFGVGSTTYRIYIDLLPGSKLKKVYGDANHTLKIASTSPFFNNVDGKTFAKDFNNLNLHKDPGYALDSWLTIGQTTKPVGAASNRTINYGVLKSQDSNSTTIVSSDAILTNTDIAIPLTVSDGMDVIGVTTFSPSGWTDSGFTTIGGGDSTIFGSTKIQSQFVSNTASFQYSSGVRGVNTDSNLVLIAQLTTKGQLAFELNVEIEELVNGVPTIVKYVANDSIVNSTNPEKFSSYLKFPPACGCKDARYLEYSNKFTCENQSACKNLIVFGCRDMMACNYNPNANYHIKDLCCYPGSCGGRELISVCPSINEDNFDFEIHPNPTQGNIYLNTLSGKSRELSYSVYDTFGTLVASKNLGTTSGLVNEEIDLSQVNYGMYLIRIDYDNAYLTKLFLKN
jgi:hypothetical protein